MKDVFLYLLLLFTIRRACTCQGTGGKFKKAALWTVLSFLHTWALDSLLEPLASSPFLFSWFCCSSLFFSFFKNIYLFVMYTIFCVHVCRPEEGIRPHYRWLWATMWLPGTELRTSGRVGNALNHWAIPPALLFFFFSFSFKKGSHYVALAVLELTI